MNYAQAIARRNEIVRRARAAIPAPLCHSPWFTPPPAPEIVAAPPPPETSHYADFLVLRMFVEALLHMADDTPIPPVVVNDEHQFLTERMTVKRVQVAVAEHYGLRLMDLVSDRRTHNVVTPRHVAMYLSKMLTPRSLPEIGSRFGRDHTTVLFAVRKVEKLVKTDAKVAADVAELMQALGGEE